MRSVSPAGSTLKRPVAVMTHVTVLDAVFVTFTLADEVEHDLHLLGEAQGLDLNALRFALFGAALSRDVNGERYLGTQWKQKTTQKLQAGGFCCG